MRPIYGSHTGENIASVLIDVIKDLGIDENIGFTTSDNALNNDTANEHFYNHLGKDWVKFRLRCGAHIFNLAAKAGLYGKDKKKDTVPDNQELINKQNQEENEEMEREIAALSAEIYNEHQLAARQAEMRKKGEMGFLVNITNHAMATIPRRELFYKLVKEERERKKAAGASDDEEEEEEFYTLVKHSATRWNGDYAMVTRGKFKFLISMLFLGISTLI